MRIRTSIWGTEMFGDLIIHLLNGVFLEVFSPLMLTFDPNKPTDASKPNIFESPEVLPSLSRISVEQLLEVRREGAKGACPHCRGFMWNHETESGVFCITPNRVHIWHTVDGKNPALVEVGSLSHYLQGFMHPRWLFGISSINSIYLHLPYKSTIHVGI